MQKLVDQEVLAHGRQCFLVDRGDRTVGLLTLHNMKEIPRPSWTATTAAQAMMPLEKLSRIDPNAELWTAMEKMGRDGVNQMPVMLGERSCRNAFDGRHRQISSHPPTSKPRVNCPSSSSRRGLPGSC